MTEAELASIAQQCEGAHQDKQGWRAKCPVHQGETDNSLHLWLEGEQLIIHCFAKCDVKNILDRLHIEKPQRRPEHFDAIYSYRDDKGYTLFQVVRKRGKDGKKTFQQRRPDVAHPGQWIWNMQGIQRTLYQLPEIQQAIIMHQTIYVVEGEKDVETLRAHGLIATTNPGGAGKWEDQYSELLKGATVVLLYDNDKAGKSHADLLITKLRGYVRSLTRIDLPDVQEREDITDWLGKGHSVSELKALSTDLPAQIVAPHLVITKLEDVETEAVEWLWEPYIPRGKLTLLEGDPGQGKTYLMLAIAAAVTQGYHLPDQQGRVAPPHMHRDTVLYLTAEDGIADTIRPRAEHAEADLSRLYVVEGWTAGADIEPFSFQHMTLLADVIRDLRIKLVIIDPIQAFLGAGVDMHRANEVRPLMAQLGRIAALHKCAIIAIRHLAKGTAKALYRGLGSIDFTAAARSVLVIAESLEDENKRVMAQEKNSLALKGTSIVFKITSEGFRWCGTSKVKADELLTNQPIKQKRQLENVSEWLYESLKNGAILVESLKDEAEANDISWRTVERAKARMRIISFQQGKKWYWKLSEDVDVSWDSDQGEDDVPF